MAANLKRLSINSSWIDLIASPGLSGMANLAAFVQNQGTGNVKVAFTSSATAPNASEGDLTLYGPGSSITGTAAHIWVRSEGDAGVICVGLAD